ncbi:hypothetical protein RhiirB3_433733 [Rhizophagus irregularis]|nr:hypothetical protein RhiirB3_433733 [Rhizophagus irregularis]
MYSEKYSFLKLLSLSLKYFIITDIQSKWLTLTLQGVPQGVTLFQTNEIFENFLKSKHGQFLNKFIKNNDSLPSYDSGMSSLKTSVPAIFSGDCPSLLHNLPRDDHKYKPITRV